MKRIIRIFKRIFVCVLLLFACVINVGAQGRDKGGLSFDERLDSMDVYLLTCQPHDEIYSLYGHTSIRVVDRLTHQDFAVNFGVFDSTAKFFALRFVFGLTDYMMAVNSFDRFLDEYRYYGSGVYQQHINLSRQEKADFFMALQENAEPENVVYRYNFLYNNCTTKARDILLGAVKGRINYTTTSLQQAKRTFRDLVHYKTANHRWAAFGNDILLGVAADYNMNHDTRQFLPEVLMNDFDSAKVIMANGGEKVLVDSAKWVLLPGTPYEANGGTEFPLSPRMMAILFFCAILSLCLIQLLMLKKRLLWLNYLLVLLYALPGIILGAMVFSKHPTVNVNLQIFIFNPLYLLILVPRQYIKWRWEAMLLFVVLFFIGNAIQSYAEGMNIMALALLMIVLTNITFERYSHLVGKK